MKFLEMGVHLDSTNKIKRRLIRIMAMQYILYGEQLYRRSYVGIHLHCLKKGEAESVMDEIHQGIYGPHMNGGC